MEVRDVLVRRLEPNDVPATAGLLAEAMAEDPAYAFLFPRPSERRRGLGDFFARNLRTYLPHRCTSVLTVGGAVAATATLRPPTGIPISMMTMLRRGLIPFAAAHGVSAVQRMLRLKNVYDGLEANIVNGAPHWFVHMMAVTPSRQGQGLGSQLLQRVLEAHTEASSAPTVLTTHQERNVVFYRRARFEVADLREVALEESPPYRVWCMRRR